MDDEILHCIEWQQETWTSTWPLMSASVMDFSMISSGSTDYRHHQGPMQKARPNINMASVVSTDHDIHRLWVAPLAICINLTASYRKIMNRKVALNGSMDHRYQHDPSWQHDPITTLQVIESTDHEHLHNLQW